MVIENRPGGDGLVSINAFTAANDDHTLLWVPVGVFAVHPFEREKLPYDADRDLLPIVGVTSLALAMSAPESLKTPTLRDFIALAKANPGKLNAAAASGNADFLLGYFLKSMNLDIAKVPYRDIMQGPNDIAEGRIQLAVFVARDRHAAVAGRQDPDPGGYQQAAHAEHARRADRARGRLSKPGDG